MNAHVPSRRTLDKVFVSFFSLNNTINPNMNVQMDLSLFLHNEMKKGNLNFGGFSLDSGFVRANLIGKKWRMVWYEPLLFFEKNKRKVISWMLFDPRNGNSKAYFNVNECYMLYNKIDPPVLCLNDTNYIPVKHEFEFIDTIYVFDEMMKFVYQEYKELLRKWNVVVPDLEIYISSIEVCEEYINKNISYVNLDKSKAEIKATYQSTNATVYINCPKKEYKHQLKVYEKTPSLLRLEHTFNKLKEYRYYSLEDLKNYLLMMMDKNHSMHSTIDIIGDREIRQDLEERYKVYYEFIVDTMRKPITYTEYNYLLSRNYYWFSGDDDSQKLRKRLQRANLIVRGFKGGIWWPSPRLQQIKDDLNAGIFVIDEIVQQYNDSTQKELQDEIKRMEEEANSINYYGYRNDDDVEER